MRQNLLRKGAGELSYEIRGIVSKAEQLQALGIDIFWENIGDPIQKNATIPAWMKEIIQNLVAEDSTYGYCHSKGVKETRTFLAKKNNEFGGVQISAEDILFFNGLGDGIAKLYQYLEPTSRIIGPSPAYSTHSSAEAAHANTNPITYRLDPDNQWYPDMNDLYLKVKYNPNIVGILIINPDNPTGMVYPLEILEQFVSIAKEFNLFLICDEIYMNIIYNGSKMHPLATIIDDVPGISLKGISKELPWPGARCGWMEFYNKNTDKQFAKLCETLNNAKMIEVCATKLPQLAIPKIMSDARYQPYRLQENEKIGKRSQIISSILGEVKGIKFNPTYGAFYNTIIFEEDLLKSHQTMTIENAQVQMLIEDWLSDKNIALDQRFVYYLLAAKNICVVPVSSFSSDLQGFRVTLLEENEEKLVTIFTKIREGIEEYLES